MGDSLWEVGRTLELSLSFSYSVRRAEWPNGPDRCDKPCAPLSRSLQSRPSTPAPSHARAAGTPAMLSQRSAASDKRLVLVKAEFALWYRLFPELFLDGQGAVSCTDLGVAVTALLSVPLALEGLAVFAPAAGLTALATV